MGKINNISKTIKFELRNVSVTRYRDEASYTGTLFINNKKVNIVEFYANTKEEVMKKIIGAILKDEYSWTIVRK